MGILRELKERNINAGMEEGVLTIYIKAENPRVFEKRREVVAAFLDGKGYGEKWMAKGV